MTRGIFIGTVDENGRVHFDFPSKAHAFNQEYFAGHEVEIEIRKRRSKRSLKQNAYLHAAIEPLAEKLGVTVAGLKLILLGEVFGWTNVLGRPYPERDHTSDLNTEEFSDVMAFAQQLAAEHGVLILDPSEYKAEKQKRERRGARLEQSGSRVLGASNVERSSIARTAEDLEGMEPSAASS